MSHHHDDHAGHDHHHGHQHQDGHDHHHGHGQHHHHVPPDAGRILAFGILLNAVFVAVEFAYGIMANSVALLADAGHNLGDVLGLVIAWIGAHLAKQPPNARYTYGLRAAPILAALANGTLLLLTAGAITWEALLRVANPEPVQSTTVMVVATIGIAINGFTAFLFAAGRKHDINLRAAFVHMAADALISLGVVVSGTVILTTGWLRLDPLVSIAINAIIVWTTWSLLREAMAMSMAAVPAHVDPGAVRSFLESQPGVSSLHDLHVWPMSPTEIALTCHLVIPAGFPGDGFVHRLSKDLADRFAIRHSTVQIETDPTIACALAPDHVI